MACKKGRSGISYLHSGALLLRILTKVVLASAVWGRIYDTRFVCSHGGRE